MRLKNPSSANILTRIKFNQGLIGPINGLNRFFTTPHKFLYKPAEGVEPVFKRNGQTVYVGVEIEDVSESGGPGTGYDTIEYRKAPRGKDKLTADYIAEA